ncbi:MAG: prolyl oligopeptidase family serine peptidase [Chloroflexota bacterium]
MRVPIAEKYERNGWPSVDRPDLTPPAGWSLSLIMSLSHLYQHKLSPDGRRIAFIWNREELADIYVMPIEGGWPARLTTSRVSTPYWWDRAPQWSPDGKWLAFRMNENVHIVAADGGIPFKLPLPVTGSGSPVWLPDSKRMIVTLEPDQSPRLYLTDRNGSFLRMLTRDAGEDSDPRPSPDGKFVAYVHWPEDDRNCREIRVVDLRTGANRTMISTPKTKDWHPRWSPDGQWIAFLSQRTEYNNVWLVHPDGTGLHQLTRLNQDVDDIAWSPDGKRLACTVNRRGRLDLALIDAESGEVTELRVGRGVYARPQWGPDGSFLTVEYEDPVTPPDFYRIEVPGGESTQLTFSNLPALARNKLVMPEEVIYKSYDGLEIAGLLYKPLKSNGAGLVHPHGGPTEQFGYTWEILVQYLVAKGYTILCPNYRGSTGYGLAFEHANYNNWGIGDVQDCIHAAKYLSSLPNINAGMLGIFGASYGGYLTVACLARDLDYWFACGVSKYGDASLVSSWAQCDRDTRLYTEMQIGHPSANWDVFIDGSAINQVENIRSPLLLLHGLDDEVVAPQSSEELSEALRRHNKTFEYKTYAGEPHGFQKNANILDAYKRIERFLDWYLLPPPIPPSPTPEPQDLSISVTETEPVEGDVQ